jgi:hypothetical protein
VVEEDLFALEIPLRVELAIALPQTYQTLVVLVQIHLKQDRVELITQVEHTVELLTDLAQVLKQMIVVLLVFAGTIIILLKYLLVTIAFQASA